MDRLSLFNKEILMKKYVYVSTAIAAIIAVSSAFAEMPAGGQPKAALDPQAQESRKAEEAMMFKNRKEEMLLHFSNKIAEMQKNKDCVQAAADKEAMMKCLPQHPMMGGGDQGGHMMGGPGGQEMPPMGGPGGHMMGGPGGQMPPMGGPGGQMPPMGNPGDPNKH